MATPRPLREEIRGVARPACLLCGTAGVYLYRGLRDRLFDAPGTWDLKQCSRAGCGLLWLDPMPAEEDLGKAYRSYYTHPVSAPAERMSMARGAYRALREGYLAAHFGYRFRHRRRLLGSLLYLHPGARIHADHGVYYQPASWAGERLLDVGCGDGGNLLQMVELGWHRAEGVEVDADAVHAARLKGLTVHHDTLASQHFPDASFGVIMMSHVIEHVHDPVALLAECFRILRPGGRLVMVTPNVESWGHARYRDAWLALDPPRHLHLFTRHTLRETLERSAGWHIATLRSTIRGASVNLIASRDIRRRGKALLTRPFSLAEQLHAHAFYYAEAAARLVRPAAGEELLLIAVKPE